MTVNLPTRCIVCGMKPDPVFKDETEFNQPYAATNFTSRGHYGSTFIDVPADGTTLSLNVCDACLEKLCASGDVLAYRDPLMSERPPRIWSIYEKHVPWFDFGDEDEEKK